ncbi:hypothetical protein C8J56DRAFT_1038181 [Mycena floridula]|nr:hypothetical protein C8J56DRAFT_1038181 [Mycena floridula]
MNFVILLLSLKLQVFETLSLPSTAAITMSTTPPPDLAQQEEARSDAEEYMPTDQPTETPAKDAEDEARYLAETKPSPERLSVLHRAKHFDLVDGEELFEDEEVDEEFVDDDGQKKKQKRRSLTSRGRCYLAFLALYMFACNISLLGGGLRTNDAAHVMAQAFKGTFMERLLAKAWDVDSICIDSFWNIFYLSPELHRMFDRSMWLLFPTLDVLRELQAWTRADKSRRLSLFDKFPTSDAVGNPKTWEYAFAPLVDFLGHEIRFPDEYPERAPIETITPDQFELIKRSLHPHPFTDVSLIKSHVHPGFVVVNAAMKLAQRQDKAILMARHSEEAALVEEIFRDWTEDNKEWKDLVNVKLDSQAKATQRRDAEVEVARKAALATRESRKASFITDPAPAESTDSEGRKEGRKFITTLAAYRPPGPGNA